MTRRTPARLDTHIGVTFEPGHNSNSVVDHPEQRASGPICVRGVVTTAVADGFSYRRPNRVTLRDVDHADVNSNAHTEKSEAGDES